MPGYNFIINDINIKNSQLKIDAAMVCSSDTSVPKLRIIFERGEDIRRLPLVSRGTFRRTETDDSVTIFSYCYLLDYVFNDKCPDDEISVRFEAEFGDEVSNELNFYLSEGIVSKFPELNIDKKYIGGDIFNGATVYCNAASVEDQEDLPLKSYVFIPCPDKGRIILRVKENFVKQKSKAFTVFSNISLKLMFAINMLLCVLLVPYFCIDAFLASLDLIPRHRAPEVTGFARIFLGQFKANIASFLRYSFKYQKIAENLIRVEERHYRKYYRKLCKKPVVENRISFISGRRDELGGNEKYVYDLIKDIPDIDFQFLMNSELDIGTKSKAKKRFYELYATSKVVIVDDYYSLLNSVDKRENVTLFQLWHACGAFKTFGFSRLGKTGSPKQNSPSHRMYDYATVSSEEVVKYYAEGFGISDSHVLPTGIPRTDIFTDKEYAARMTDRFYGKYPHLKGRKIVMFAPTFRGAGQKSAYYPVSAFDPNKFYEDIGDEYAVIIKLHPFCKEKFTISQKYRDYVIDLSEEDEINDLLFVTDILITDYSSSVFEASLLDIPMLFYSYDLYQYISERDFYCDFESFVPGKIAFTQAQLSEAVKNGDFRQDRIESFKHRYFTDIDGKSSQRVADKIIEALKG